jgi:hypothetical protein
VKDEGDSSGGLKQQLENSVVRADRTEIFWAPAGFKEV